MSADMIMKALDAINDRSESGWAEVRHVPVEQKNMMPFCFSSEVEWWIDPGEPHLSPMVDMDHDANIDLPNLCPKAVIQSRRLGEN